MGFFLILGGWGFFVGFGGLGFFLFFLGELAFSVVVLEGLGVFSFLEAFIGEFFLFWGSLGCFFVQGGFFFSNLGFFWCLFWFCGKKSDCEAIHHNVSEPQAFHFTFRFEITPFKAALGNSNLGF